MQVEICKEFKCYLHVKKKNPVQRLYCYNNLLYVPLTTVGLHRHVTTIVYHFDTALHYNLNIPYMLHYRLFCFVFNHRTYSIYRSDPDYAPSQFSVTHLPLVVVHSCHQAKKAMYLRSLKRRPLQSSASHLTSEGTILTADNQSSNSNIES